MDKNLSIPDFIRQHCGDSMKNALTAVRYTTWERNCPELSDTDFTYLGLLRCMTPVDSGRHFIQNTKQLHEIPCLKKWIEEECNINNVNGKLYIYDRAATNYKWWDEQKKNDIHMISVLKENAVTALVKTAE